MIDNGQTGPWTDVTMASAVVAAAGVDPVATVQRFPRFRNVQRQHRHGNSSS